MSLRGTTQPLKIFVYLYKSPTTGDESLYADLTDLTGPIEGKPSNFQLVHVINTTLTIPEAPNA